jgi:hypothetical protein
VGTVSLDSSSTARNKTDPSCTPHQDHCKIDLACSKESTPNVHSRQRKTIDGSEPSCSCTSEPLQQDKNQSNVQSSLSPKLKAKAETLKAFPQQLKVSSLLPKFLKRSRAQEKRSSAARMDLVHSETVFTFMSDDDDDQHHVREHMNLLESRDTEEQALQPGQSVSTQNATKELKTKRVESENDPGPSLSRTLTQQAKVEGSMLEQQAKIENSMLDTSSLYSETSSDLTRCFQAHTNAASKYDKFADFKHKKRHYSSSDEESVTELMTKEWLNCGLNSEIQPSVLEEGYNNMRNHLTNHGNAVDVSKYKQSHFAPNLSELFRIRRAVIAGKLVQAMYVLTFLNMFLCLLELYKAFGRYGVLWSQGPDNTGDGGENGRTGSSSTVTTPSPWPWLTFQSLSR